MIFKLNPTQKYLIAVSGGPDSIFLLLELINGGYKNLVVCHVNYNWRTDSNVDQQIVEEICKINNLTLEIKNIDSSIYQNFKLNFEDWARKTRYDFFVEIGEKYGIKNLLIAHNENDLIETYFIQKQRNNLVSYYGLKKVTEYKNLIVIRPMLNIKKSEILKKLEINKIKYAIDSTNENDKYLRNKIRMSLNESDFEKYLHEINLLNEELQKELQKAYFYANNNLTADQLIINETMREMELRDIQRIIFEYLKLIKHENLLSNRSNNTSLEIAKEIKNSTKSFWKIEINENVFVKDFDKVYILNKSDLVPKTVLLNNEKDLIKIHDFMNWLDLYNAIKNDGEKYPYIVSTDFDKYKLITYVGNKKTNRFLIDKKIPYKTRFFKAVVYQKDKLKILNRLT